MINRSLNYAKENDWSNPYTAIDGAAKKISDDYIKKNQNTIYYQKFNVIGENKYDHQYMANVNAPISESKRTYDTYKECNLLDNDFVFCIPVYDQ